MYEIFLSYIGSSWFFIEQNNLMNIMGTITVVSMLIMARLYLKMYNIKQSNLLTFLYSLIGCNVLAFSLYGYIAIPLCVFWMWHVKKITEERIKYYYIREANGHLGGWHEPSDLDDILDYDKLIDELTFDKNKMSKFYSSDAPIWGGALITIIVIFVCMIIFKGYRFFPKEIELF